MSIFGKIKDAIFGRKAQAQPVPQSPQPSPAGQAPGQGQAMPQINTPSPTPDRMVDVDVDAILAQAAAEKGQELNYKTSIVDLMKLLDLDSSLDNRKELATELGYTGDKDGSAEMNIWLHKEVMRQLAQHGGKVPANLTD
jgi:hypothetical protein